MAPLEDHWNRFYARRRPDEASWFQTVPERSLELIREYATKDARILDVGGGTSKLVDHLLDHDYAGVSVLDISAAPLEAAKQRLGERARRVHWIVSDISIEPPLEAVDVWHDRAVLHFLTTPEAQTAYVETAASTVVPGGTVIVATFALDGPEKCSGLPVKRHDGTSLARLFGPRFELVEERPESHVTPKGAEQRFCWAVLRRR